MNPLVRAHLDQIRAAIAGLEAAAAARKEQLARERAKRDELQQQVWTRRKQLSVLEQGQQDYEALRAENTRLKEAQSELAQRLGRVLAYTKALTGELRQ